MKSKPLLVIVLFILVLASFSIADVEYKEISCNDCQAFFGEQGRCNPLTNTCFLVEELTTLTQSAAPIIDLTPTPLESENEKIISLQQRLTLLEDQQKTFQQQLDRLSSEVNLAPQQINTLQQDLNDVTTGLASIQSSIQETQSELNDVEENLSKGLSFTKIVSYIFLILLSIAVALTLIYYINKNKSKKISPEVKNYITNHIKNGKRFPEIKTALIQAGWNEEDIKWAYKETTKHNYKKYKSSSSKSLDKNKTIFISVFTILLLIGVFFLLRGATGKAIVFNSDQEFAIAVRSNLDTYLPNNQFYSLIPNANLCIQVYDGNKDVSYSIVKTPSGHTVSLARLPCYLDINYDGVILFTDWKSFNVVSRKADCNNFRTQHKDGFYILPSQYVLPGFKKNPTKDYNQFCSALNTCLTPSEAAIIGC